MSPTSTAVRIFTVRDLIEELEKCDPTYAVVLARTNPGDPLMVINDHDRQLVTVVAKSSL